LARIIVPVLNENFRQQFEAIENIVLTEVNVKKVEYLTDSSGIIKKKIKPNFKTLGPKYGKLMKQIAAAVAEIDQAEIVAFEREGYFDTTIDGEAVRLVAEDVEILTEDIPGWQVASEGNLTIALDIEVTPELRLEGIARELINRIQNLRKDSGFEVTDKIELSVGRHPELAEALDKYGDYICTQTLAGKLKLVDITDMPVDQLVEIEPGLETYISVRKI
jgi:isoleucyl-tRNA synthetase